MRGMVRMDVRRMWQSGRGPKNRKSLGISFGIWRMGPIFERLTSLT